MGDPLPLPREVYDTVQQAVLTLSGSFPSLAPGDFPRIREGRGALGGVFQEGGHTPQKKPAATENLFGRVSSPFIS
ncbi:hypothetical protein MASR2M17_01390 [Aminivibrio sp.]